MVVGRRRNAVRAVVAAAVGLTAVVVGAAAWVYLAPLPDPGQADREGLFRWIVTRDLSQEPYAVRQALAGRLDRELQGEVEWDEVGDQLTEAYRERLWANIPYLLEPWLALKIDAYFAASPSDRPRLLDDTLDTVLRFNGLQRICPDCTPEAMLKILMAQVAVLQANAAPAERERINEFVTAIQGRFWKRLFNGQSPEEKTEKKE